MITRINEKNTIDKMVFKTNKTKKHEVNAIITPNQFKLNTWKVTFSEKSKKNETSIKYSTISKEVNEYEYTINLKKIVSIFDKNLAIMFCFYFRNMQKRQLNNCLIH